MSEENINKEIDSQDLNPSSHQDWYNQIRVLIESMELDVLKAQKNNKAASVRLRKSLRYLKSETGKFVKFTLGKDPHS